MGQAVEGTKPSPINLPPTSPSMDSVGEPATCFQDCPSFEVQTPSDARATSPPDQETTPPNDTAAGPPAKSPSAFEVTSCQFSPVHCRDGAEGRGPLGVETGPTSCRKVPAAIAATRTAATPTTAMTLDRFRGQRRRGIGLTESLPTPSSLAPAAASPGTRATNQ